MAFDKVDPKADFPAQERVILDFWDKTKAFDKLREINAGKPRWSFLDGPITANNPMGVHHAWGRTYKDIYQRYHASIGRELRYQNGFDCQGLWVEVEVEKEHDFACKKDIETFGIDRFVEECKARARKFAAIQTEQSIRLGYWMDWTNSYYTMTDENNYGIWAFLKKCHERGLVYKGFDVMPWCPRCGTGISQMEMNEGYREVPHTSVFIVFPIRERPGENLLVWTTTPWTLSSNVAAAVGAEMTYIKIKQGDQYYYLGKGNFENPRAHPVQDTNLSTLPPLKTIDALFKSRGPYEIVEEVEGQSLADLTFKGPFDYLEGAAEAIPGHRVVVWDEVSESEGTGIVHIAPGCGSEDYHLGKELGLPQVAPLYEDGRFRPEFGFLAGKRFDEVADAVVADLKKRDRLFAAEQYFHRYPHCWRCGDELVYRLVDEWFINMKWRDEIAASAKQARWIPEWGIDRELDWLRNMGDWMISKKRYWGLALPIWECHECGHFEVIGGKEELQARAVNGWDEFEGHSPHKPWVDAVKIRCAQCGSEGVSRVNDVGNPWLDASIVSLSTVKYFSDRAYWEKWFPADFIVEALPGQFRNWFYALLAVSTMMVGRSPFKTLKGHGLVMDDEGKPMHKSAGNAMDFNDAAETIGVDVMRWLYATTPPERNVLFGPKHTDEARRGVILPWWNVYSFFCNLARIDKFNPCEPRASARAEQDSYEPRAPARAEQDSYEPRAPARAEQDSYEPRASARAEQNAYEPRASARAEQNAYEPRASARADQRRNDSGIGSTLEGRSLLDRWILSDLHKLIRTAHEAYSNFDVARFAHEAERFIEVLSTWYVRRSRRRFYGRGWPTDKRAAYSTLYDVLTTFNRLIAPIVPFMAESIYRNLVANQIPDAAESVHHVPFPQADESLIDESLSAKVDASLRLMSLARSARKESKLKIRQPLAELVIVPGNDTEREAVGVFEDHFLEELNVKKVTLRDQGEDLYTVKVLPNMKTLGPKLGRHTAAGREAIANLDGKTVEETLDRGAPVTIKVDGEHVDLDRNDLIVTRHFGEDWAGASDGQTITMIDKRITPELKREGIARDIVRNVQNLRKDAGLDIADRIKLSLVTESQAVKAAVDQCAQYIRDETLTVELTASPLGGDPAQTTVKIDGEEVAIDLVKRA